MKPAHGSATVIQGDARKLDGIDDDSVDLIVTSPPYWALRAYQDNGETYDGQIGAEPTPAAYIDSLIDCTAEWVRVLKPSGSLFVNLGDKYNSAASGQQSTLAAWSAENARGGGHKPAKATPGRGRSVAAVPQKSLIGLPWRYAIRCIDDLGLILRAEVIWEKKNPLPESVTDRVRRSHEQWFHFVKSPRYFAAVDTIREPHMAPIKPRGVGGYDGANGQQRHGFTSDQNPLGKLPSSVWQIATQPLKVPAELGVGHFAAFPMEWPRRIIQGWSPSGICTACGEGRRPLTVRGPRVDRRPSQHREYPAHLGGHETRTLDVVPDYRITGEACACPDVSAPTRPAVVLDPFGGTGTTATVAKALGRLGITVDMSADYCLLAQWRTNDPKQLQRAAAPRTGAARRRREGSR